MDLERQITEDEKMVQYYVYLEALKRLKDEESEIMKSLALKVVRYQESLLNYLELYGKYVDIVKLMENHNLLRESQQKRVEKAIHEANVTRMIQQLKNNMNSEQFDRDQLLQLKEHLTQFTDFTNTKRMFQITQHKDGRAKGIDQSLSRIEAETKNAIDILVRRITETFHKMWQPVEFS